MLLFIRIVYWLDMINTILAIITQYRFILQNRTSFSESNDYASSIEFDDYVDNIEEINHQRLKKRTSSLSGSSNTFEKVGLNDDGSYIDDIDGEINSNSHRDSVKAKSIHHSNQKRTFSNQIRCFVCHNGEESCQFLEHPQSRFNLQREFKTCLGVQCFVKRFIPLINEEKPIIDRGCYSERRFSTLKCHSTDTVRPFDKSELYTCVCETDFCNSSTQLRTSTAVSIFLSLLTKEYLRG
ncbi:unnamed protein product [Dimorphilus gyrociliatus]|uniref:Uncharacterized protein n=1 Tax=Dimorphilus gyrociliatus TaxID=2664684 RepID=A0A7I8VV93_9ANNE|nr:unnamed protein product [Dimorphilus gyrociliatus]